MKIITGKISFMHFWQTDPQYMPAFRYAFGSTLIMAIAMASGGELAYIVPLLALSFLAPGTKVLTFKQGIGFIATVLVTSMAGFLFTSFFYAYTWVVIPLLALILFWVFYTTKLTFVAKLFLLIAFLAMPVPSPGLSTTIWSYAIAKTLVSGSVFSVLVIWTVYAIFPDRPEAKSDGGSSQTKAAVLPSPRERFTSAMEIFVVTFPIVLAFIVFQWSSALLILLYVVILTMIPVPGHAAGKVKIYGNLIGGAAVIIFYKLIVIVPSFFFFLVLFLASALFFATKIFSDKPSAALYKTGFSTLTLIIGETSIGTETAGSKIWIRVIQVMIAVFIVVGTAKLVDAYKIKRIQKAEHKLQKSLITEV